MQRDEEHSYCTLCQLEGIMFQLSESVQPSPMFSQPLCLLSLHPHLQLSPLLFCPLRSMPQRTNLPPLPGDTKGLVLLSVP
ncbi:hypothetical protein FKM82_000157 [Ascaphus truei]